MLSWFWFWYTCEFQSWLAGASAGVLLDLDLVLALGLPWVVGGGCLWLRVRGLRCWLARVGFGLVLWVVGRMVLGLGLVLLAAGGCRLLLVAWLVGFAGWGSSVVLRRYVFGILCGLSGFGFGLVVSGSTVFVWWVWWWVYGFMAFVGSVGFVGLESWFLDVCCWWLLGCL